MKVNLIKENSTNSNSEVQFIYKLGSLWERENQIKPNKGIMYLFASDEGHQVFSKWMYSKGINAHIDKYDNLATVVTIDDTPELTKLLLES